jgi:dTDP-4-amino-4,6-dideoxygalactose transaminase
MSELAIFGGKPTISGPWPKWPELGERERTLLDEVLASSIWGGTGLGPKIRELDEKFAAYCGVKHGAAVANGTVSMELCLEAWGIGPGDEVVAPAATFMATAIAAHHQGATVVYADLDPKTANLDPARFEEAISEKTKAVIPVHIGGHPCDMDPTVDIARRRGIKVLEDAAQAHGAIYKGRMAGSLGDAGSFSFQQSKNMQSGEGGFITSDDADFIDRIHYSLGKFGRGIRDKYAGHIHYNFGWNACYTEIQAAIALGQLERLEAQTQKRSANAKLLLRELEGIEGIEPFRYEPYCTRHGHHLFLVRFDSPKFDKVSRAQFLAALNAEGVPASSFYPMPLYEQPLYKSNPRMKMRALPCPVTESLCREVIFFEQNLLLAEPDRIVLIAAAVKKLRRGAKELQGLKAGQDEFMGSAVLRQARKTGGRRA